MIAEEDLKSKDLPLPASYESSFGTFSLAVGDPFPDYEKDKDGKPVLGKDGKIQPLGFTLSYAGSDAVSGEGTRSKTRRPSITIPRRPPSWPRTTGTLPSSRPVSPS